MPVSVNKTLGANDRCSPGGAVISAYLSAIVEAGMVIGWMKNSAFSVQKVQPDGTLTPLDLTAVAMASRADSADTEANRVGVVGIPVTSLLLRQLTQCGRLPLKRDTRLPTAVQDASKRSQPQQDRTGTRRS